MEICTPEVSSDNSALLDRISKLENIIDHLMEVKPVSDYNEQKQQRAHTIDKQTTEKQANTAVNSFNDDDAPPFDMDEEDSHKKSATLIPMAEKPSAKITEVAIDTNKADEIDESDDSDIDISGNDGSEFTQKDYEKLLNKIKSVDKALFTLLFESTFESFRNGVLNIRFSEKNHIFAKALQNPANMEKTKIFINKSGFKTSNICVTIGKASATPANKLDVIYNVLDKDKIKIID